MLQVLETVYILKFQMYNNNAQPPKESATFVRFYSENRKQKAQI